MSFGQSGTAKEAQAATGAATKNLADVGSGADQRSASAFNMFKKAAKGPMNFWQSILSGDRTSIMSLLGPEIGASNAAYDSAGRQAESLLPRGGGKVSAEADIATQKAGSVNSIIAKARPMAAEQLAALANLFSSTSLGETGAAISGFGSSGQLGIGTQQIELQRQQMLNSFISSLAQAAGGAAGDLFFGKFGGGK